MKMVFTDLIFVSFIISKAKHLKLFLDINNNNNVNSRKECTVPLKESMWHHRHSESSPINRNVLNPGSRKQNKIPEGWRELQIHRGYHQREQTFGFTEEIMP